MSESFKPLESERLILRRFQASDVAPFHAYRSDPNIARYQGWTDFSLEDAQRFVEKQAMCTPGALGSGVQIAIVHKASGEMIGDVFLQTPSDTPLEAQIGYTLAAHHQGRGFATEAVGTLLDFIFGPLQKRRVTALTYAQNGPSVALLERIGMRREAHHVGSSQFGGEWVDDYVYALLSEEWRER